MDKCLSSPEGEVGVYFLPSSEGLLESNSKVDKGSHILMFPPS